MNEQTRSSRSRTPRAAAVLSIPALLVLAAFALSACTQQPQSQPSEPPAAEEAAPESPTTETTKPEAPTGYKDVTELKTEDLEEGSGAEATAGKNVTVHYTGWLVDGTEFDSSYNSGQPFTFALGGGQVIPGWDQGVQGMKVGGTRRLVIPPDMGYGPSGTPDGTIPPNATLIFDVTLLDVQ